MKRRLIDVLTATPILWIVLVGAFTAVLGWRAIQLPIGADLMESWPEDDPDRLLLEDTLEEFGRDGGAVMAVSFDETVFTEHNLQRVARWTALLEPLPGVTEVESLTNIRVVGGSSEGIGVSRLLPDPIPSDARELSELGRRALRYPEIRKLLSEDRRATAILVSYPDDIGYEPVTSIGRSMRELAEREAELHPDVRFYTTGRAAFLDVFQTNIRAETRILYPVALLVMWAVLSFSFRGFRAVAVPMVVGATATTWTAGMLEVTGRTLNSSSVALPAIVIVLAVADTVHIVSQYLANLRRRPDRGRRELMAETLDAVLPPCALTTFTTVVGFGSLQLVDVPLVQETGRFVCFGVLAAFLVSFTLVPAFYLIGPAPSQAPSLGRADGPIARALGALLRIVFARPRTVAGLVGALVLSSAAGLVLLRVDFRWERFIDAAHPIREAIRFVDREFGGYNWVCFVLSVSEDTEGDFLDREKLALSARVHEAAERFEIVGHVDSLPSSLERANEVFHDGDPLKRVLPRSRPLIAQYLLVLEGTDGPISGVLSSDRRTTLVSVRMRSPGRAETRRMLEEIEGLLGPVAGEVGVELKVTGWQALFAKLNKTITHGLVSSLSATLVIVSALMMATLRNPRLGLAAMIPNAIPVLATFGTMGWLGIDLSTQTAMIGCIGIGLAVDDTIHVLHRFRLEFERNGGDRRAAIEAAVQGAGRAVVLTTLVLVAGFSVLALSSFTHLEEFGLLMAVTMGTALVGDLVLLPLMLLRFPQLSQSRRAAPLGRARSADRPASTP